MQSGRSVGRRVAVIGGGAAGIVSAKWLRDAGLNVVVFEKAARLGGVWRYDDEPDSCAYQSLRTNLPTAIMQLRGFEYPPGVPSYPSHAEVRAYLAAYAAHFGVEQHVRFRSAVTQTTKAADGRRWELTVRCSPPGAEPRGSTEHFDHLVVCNGHYSVPFCVPIEGIERFRGDVVHSQAYRTPDRFVGKSVLVIGNGPSGGEISAELARGGAKQVTVAFPRHRPPPERSNQAGEAPRAARVLLAGVAPDGSLLLSDGSRVAPGEFEALQAEMARAAAADAKDARAMRPKVARVAPDGRAVEFVDGSVMPAPDVIMFCTGYVYSTADVAPAGLLLPASPPARAEAERELGEALSAELRAATTQGFAVAPLYKQVVAIEDPSVAFVGLPFDTVPFQCCELQAMWLARVLSGAQPLPSRDAMYADLWAEVRRQDRPLGRNFHQLGARRHVQYMSDVAALAQTQLDMVGVQVLVDAVGLAISFPAEFRRAEYERDAATGACTRRFTPEGSPTALTKTFE